MQTQRIAAINTIWLFIAGFMGALNSLTIYLLNTLLVRILDPVQ